MRRVLLLCSLAALVQLVGCTREIRWQEEVPLNTGEVIWVERKDSFKLRGSPGNPLAPSWSLEERTYAFGWRGQESRYQQRDSFGPMVLGIVHGSPVMVDRAIDCEQQGYAEYRWEGLRWVLQENVSPELIGQPRNLMNYWSAEGVPERVTSEFRTQKDTSVAGPLPDMRLANEKIAINCRRG